MSVSLSVYLFVFLSVCLFVCLSLCLCICLSFSLSVYLFVCFLLCQLLRSVGQIGLVLFNIIFLYLTIVMFYSKLIVYFSVCPSICLCSYLSNTSDCLCVGFSVCFFLKLLPIASHLWTVCPCYIFRRCEQLSRRQWPVKPS